MKVEATFLYIMLARVSSDSDLVLVVFKHCKSRYVYIYGIYLATYMNRNILHDSSKEYSSVKTRVKVTLYDETLILSKKYFFIYSY
jgi:hypothetical protein